MREVLSFVGMKLHAILGGSNILRVDVWCVRVAFHRLVCLSLLHAVCFAPFCGGTQRDTATPKNLLEAFLIEAHCTHPHIGRV